MSCIDQNIMTQERAEELWGDVSMADVVLATEPVEDVHNPYPGALFVYRGYSFYWLKDPADGSIGWQNLPTESNPHFNMGVIIHPAATMEYVEQDHRTKIKKTETIEVEYGKITGPVKKTKVTYLPNPYYDDKPDYRCE